METHSSIHAWKILWTEEPGQRQSMGSQRIEHDWATEHIDTCSYSERKTGHPYHVTHLLSSASSLGFHGLGDQRSLAYHCIPDCPGYHHQHLGDVYASHGGGTSLGEAEPSGKQDRLCRVLREEEEKRQLLMLFASLILSVITCSPLSPAMGQPCTNPFLCPLSHLLASWLSPDPEERAG